MTLLNGALAAAGLACIAIPIIIHLLMHRRRKPVLWGAMRFLLEAYKRHQRRLVLEKWLLLAARCLLIAAVALALGKPLVGAFVGGAGGHHLFLLIDNGLASQAKPPGEPSALERHKAQARALISSLRERGARLGGEPDRIGLIALAGPAEGLVMPATTDLAALLDLIDNLPAADSRTDIPGGFGLVAAALNGAGAASGGAEARRIDPARTIVVLLSDFAEGSLDGAAGGDTLGATRLPEGVRLLMSEPAPGAALASNISIASVEPLRSVLVGPGAESGDQVRVVLRRSGTGLEAAQATMVRADLRVLDPSGVVAGGADMSAGERATVRWQAGEDTAVAFVPLGADAATARAMRTGGAGGSPSPGVIVASIDADAVAGDNRWFRPVDVRAALRVGVVAPSQFGRAERADRLEPGAWVRLALAPAGEGGEIEVVDVEPAALDTGRLLGLDALVLPRPDAVPEDAWTRVRSFVDSGGLLVVAPPPDVTVHLWADAMSRSLGAGWALAREGRETTGTRIVRVGAADSGAPETGDRGLSLLGHIEGELDDLLRAVSISRMLPLAAKPDTGAALLALEDGTPLLWAGTPERAASAGAPGHAGADEQKDRTGAGGRGLIVYLGAALDLEWSDLPAKPLMVPLVQEIIRQGVGEARGSWWSLAGSRVPVPARAAELSPVGRLSGSAGDAERAADRPSVRVDAAGQAASPLRTSGVYRALDPGGAVRGVVAVNADPRAGRMRAQTREAVGAWTGALFGRTGAPAGSTDDIAWLERAGAGGGEGTSARAMSAGAVLPAMLGENERGSPIWFALLVAAVALALIELVLARWASHAGVESGGAPGAPIPAGAAPASPLEGRP